MAPQPRDVFRSRTRLIRPRKKLKCVCVCVEGVDSVQCVEWLRKIRLFEREMTVYRTFFCLTCDAWFLNTCNNCYTSQWWLTSIMDEKIYYKICM